MGIFARLAMMPFLTLVARFHTKPLMQDYVEKYCKVAVSMFLKSVERIYTASGAPNALDTNKIRQELSLEIIQKISALKIVVYAGRMLPAVKVVCEEYERIYCKTHPVLSEIQRTLLNQLSTATSQDILS